MPNAALIWRELFDNSWQRYLLSVIREELPFHEVPVKLYLRQREQAEERRSKSDPGFGQRHTEHGETEGDGEEFDDDDWKDELRAEY